MDRKQEWEGEIEMNACAIKLTTPFVAKGKLKRTPATEDNKKMVEFMDSHNFSFDVDMETKTLECRITNK